MYCSIFGLLILFYMNNQSFSDLKFDPGRITYALYTKDVTQADIIYTISKNKKYDFFQWPSSPGEPSRVRVLPEDQLAFENILQKAHIRYEILEESEAMFDEDNNETYFGMTQRSKNDLIDFKKFLTLDEIYKYLDKIAKNYGQYVIKETIGKSFENRDIYSIKITNKKYNKNNKNNAVILIDGGMHPREWITHAGALYIINQLVEHYNENSKLLRSIDWLIIPVVNPDGYVYTQTHNRLWRKTRQSYNHTNCIGADINRNFPYMWQYKNNPCTEWYSGPDASSESETRALINVMLAVKDRAILYISLHSYGRQILYPWAWTIKASSNRKEHQSIAAAAARAMQRFSHKTYRIGSPPEILYSVRGANLDYAYRVGNIPHAFAIEMPGDNYTFFPPAINILPYVQETWIGIKKIVKKVSANHVYSKNIAKSIFNINFILQPTYWKLSFIMSVAIAILITRNINHIGVLHFFS